MAFWVLVALLLGCEGAREPYGYTPAREYGAPLPPLPPPLEPVEPHQPVSEYGVPAPAPELPPPPPVEELPPPPPPQPEPEPEPKPLPPPLKPASLTITSSKPKVFYGQYPIFTITATGVEGSSVPTGKVAIAYKYFNQPGHLFQEGVTANVDLDNGGIQYKPVDLRLGSGLYVYTVTYGGDAVYESGATASLEQTVRAKLVPNPKVTSSLNPSVYNSFPPTFTVTVTSLEPENPPIYATGKIIIEYTFYNSPGQVFQKSSESQVLDAQGQVKWIPASLRLGGGVYEYSISYPGDDSYQPGGTSITQTVYGRAVPAPSFTSSESAVWYGSPPTLTVSIVPLGPVNFKYPPASGKLSIEWSYYNAPGKLFSSGKFEQTLQNGKVSWVPSHPLSLGSGTYNFAASYPGDEFYQVGGTVFTQIVKPKLVPNPRVTSSLNPSVYNSFPPTFTLSIPSLEPQNPPVYATGVVTVAYTFYNSPGQVFQKSSETRTLGAGGQVSWIPPALSLGGGVYEFTFSYPGDKAYQPGATSFTQTVQGRAVPAPSLVSSRNPFTYYVNLPTYTLTINSLSPNNGFPKPSGQVTIDYVFYFPPGVIFQKGTESVQTLVNGQVSWIPQCFRLGSGTYVIGASYPGDEFYQSGGTSYTQIVTPGSLLDVSAKVGVPLRGQDKEHAHGILAP